MTGSSSDPSVGRFHQPAVPICLDHGQYPGATGDAFLSAKALMKDFPIPIAGLPGDFVCQDDERLFAFVETLRLSVKARVAAEQLRGLSLSEIVVQVREMTRLAEQEAQDPKPFSPHAFRAISRQAVAWCIEAYHPPVFVDEQDSSAGPSKLSLPAVLAPAGASVNRLPTQSPT